jgi:peptidyl-prolyl cis-trans isomerase C
MKRLGVIIMLATLIFACSEGKNSEPITKKETNPMEEISLAKVNGSPITAEDLRNEFNLLSGQAQQMFMTEGGFENLLDELIKKEMLYQEARKKNYTSDEEFKKIIDDYRKRVMIGFLLREEVEEKSKASDSEIRKYYDDNEKEFMLETPEKGEAAAVDFESVKDLIRQHIESQKETEIFDSFIGKLKETYNVEIDKDAFNSTFGNMTAPSLDETPHGE